MSYSARVRRKVHSVREVVCATDNLGQLLELVFRHVRRFVKKDNVPFLSLVLQNVSLVLAVAELYSAPVREEKRLFAFFVFRNSVKKLRKRNNVVFF